LITAVEPDCWPIKVDPGELEVALVNLTLNARDAMPDGGTVVVSSENVTLAANATPAGLQGEFVALSVADTGTGIAPDIVAKVFEPFFTTKSEGKGSGLGLSQVYGFAHQSAGTVTLRSTLGRGTTFTLYLPRSTEEAVTVRDAPDPKRAAGGTVLLVEDNPEVAGESRHMLEQLGYAVRLATDGKSALASIEAERFDLVVSDIIMAGDMDGLGLAKAVRERNLHLPVLLVTGYSEAAARVASEYPVLRKPYQLAELSRATAHLIADAGQARRDNVVRLGDVRSAPDRDDGK